VPGGGRVEGRTRRPVGGKPPKCKKKKNKGGREGEETEKGGPGEEFFPSFVLGCGMKQHRTIKKKKFRNAAVGAGGLEKKKLSHLGFVW